MVTIESALDSLSLLVHMEAQRGPGMYYCLVASTGLDDQDVGCVRAGAGASAHENLPWFDDW